MREKGAAPASPSLKHENAEGDFFLHDERRKWMKCFDMKRNFPAPCAPTAGQVLLLSKAGVFAGEAVGRGGEAGPGRGHPPAHPRQKPAGSTQQRLITVYPSCIYFRNCFTLIKYVTFLNPPLPH